jgi:hypothetical protein
VASPVQVHQCGLPASWSVLGLLPLPGSSSSLSNKSGHPISFASVSKVGFCNPNMIVLIEFPSISRVEALALRSQTQIIKDEYPLIHIDLKN